MLSERCLLLHCPGAAGEGKVVAVARELFPHRPIVNHLPGYELEDAQAGRQAARGVRGLVRCIRGCRGGLRDGTSGSALAERQGCGWGAFCGIGQDALDLWLGFPSPGARGSLPCGTALVRGRIRCRKEDQPGSASESTLGLHKPLPAPLGIPNAQLRQLCMPPDGPTVHRSTRQKAIQPKAPSSGRHGRIDDVAAQPQSRCWEDIIACPGPDA